MKKKTYLIVYSKMLFISRYEFADGSRYFKRLFCFVSAAFNNGGPLGGATVTCAIIKKSPIGGDSNLWILYISDTGYYLYMLIKSIIIIRNDRSTVFRLHF